MRIQKKGQDYVHPDKKRLEFLQFHLVTFLNTVRVHYVIWHDNFVIAGGDGRLQSFC